MHRFFTKIHFTLNNKELQSAIASKLEITQSEAETLLQATVRALVAQLQENKIVNIQGFGSFEVKKKEERLTVNPKTKKRTITPPKLALAFKTSSVYREKIKDLPHEE